MVSVGEFLTLLERPKQEQPYLYHFWALEDADAAAVCGLASFFTLPTAGFGGYIALAPPIRGTGALPTILARIELQMIDDGTSARGWYIECEDGNNVAGFSALGFFEIDIAYYQPLCGSGAANDTLACPRLHLLYKEFGAQYEPPSLTTAEFVAALSESYRYVYKVDLPESHSMFKTMIATAESWTHVPFVPLDCVSEQ
jgi:hypothetical protein